MLQEVNSDQVLDNEQPQGIEVTLKEFDEMVEYKEALDRLLSNPDFKLIIENDYLKDDAERLLGLLMSNNRQVIQDRDIINQKIYGKGYLKQWLASQAQALDGIDNPEQRAELVRQLAELEQEA